MKSFYHFLSSTRFSRYLKPIFLIGDVVILSLSYLLSSFLRFDELTFVWKKNDQSIFMLSILLWILLVSYTNAYKVLRVEKIYMTISKTIKVMMLHVGAVSILLVVLNFDNISRLRMFIFYCLFLILLITFRASLLKAIKHARKEGFNFKRVIIIGANDMGEKMNNILQRDLSYGYQVMGAFCNQPEKKASSTLQLLGKHDEIENYILNNKIDEMYIALEYQHTHLIPELIALCEKNMIRMKIVPNFQKYTKSRKVNINFYENTPVLMLREEPQELASNRIIKKLFDTCFSFLVITLVLTWLFPILILIVKLSSKGPAFFKQHRTGENKETFTCYKFRTMEVNQLADEMQAKKGDPRITKIGAFMRKTNLDEFPQFFNVLFGQMSIVGPRPHMLKHTEQYSALINDYLVRHFAKPGITGWAQVNGFRGETKELIDMKRRVEYDIWYIENWTFLLDLKIIYMTVMNMFKGEKNAG